MENTYPAISIIVPTYNVEKYITYCMDSILGQTFKDFEVIIVDDVSEDNTYEICSKLYAKLSCVTLLRNTVNKGQWYARNMGIANAKGKYLFFMDDDDELLPGALDILYNVAEKEQADVVHTNLYAMVYSEDRMLPRKSLWKRSRCQDTGEGVLTGSLSEKLNYQAAMSMPMPWLNLFRREFLVSEGIEFPKMVYGEDNVFAIAVCLKAKKFIRINELLYLYRSYFDQKGRMIRRFPKAFEYVPIFLRGYNEIFDSFTEQELPYENRRSFITSWLMAHLKFCVFDIMNSDEKKAFSAINKNLKSLCTKGGEFTAYLINLLEHSYGFHERIPIERNQKRENAKRFFRDLALGRSGFEQDYSYIYCEAKLATYIEGGDDSFYSKAYGCLAQAALNLGKYKEASKTYENCLEYVARSTDDFFSMLSQKMAILPLLNLSYKEMLSALAVYKEHFDEVVPYSYDDYRGCKKKKLRLGLLLADDASDWFAVYYGLLFACDKERFEVFCYYNGRFDGYVDFIQENIAKLVDIKYFSCKEIVNAIHEDAVDVLIDLTGNTALSFMPILSYRPAPFQIAGIERLSPLGENFVDCYLTDNILTPQNANDNIEEKLLTMPCRYSYAMRNDVLASSGTPALDKKCLTLGVFARYRHISNEMLGVWRDILEQLPGARLLMNMEELSKEAMRVEASERMFSLGFDMSRVDMEGCTGDRMARYLQVDILLGTYPVMDIAGILDALYMGVPVMIMYGERLDTRGGLSLLKRIGMEQYVASTFEEYVVNTITLAGHLNELDEMHKNLRDKLKASLDLRPVKWVRKLETKIREMVYM